MSEETGNSLRTEGSGEQPTGRRRRRKSFDLLRARGQTVGALSTVVRWAGTLAAVILTAHVVLVVGGANPDNSITRFVAAWAEPLALGFENLFPQPDQPKLDVLINYGLAALFWLVATSLAVRIVRALA